jgi:molybdopterin converting factor small subunit
MRITVKIGDLLWRIAGERQIDLQLTTDATAADGLAELYQLYPALATELPPGGTTRGGLPYYYFVNRRLVGERNLAACRLKDGDTLLILSPTAGG